MSNTLIELFAKPTVSIKVQQTQNQRVFSQFVCRSPDPDGSGLKEGFKQLQKQIAKHLFTTYQKMMLSIETLLLAFQLMETYEFRNMVQKQLEKHRFASQNSSFESVSLLKLQTQGQEQKSTSQRISSLITKIYSIGLLYLCHKITDDLRHKFASNVWVENLRLESIKKEDIQKAQGEIAVSLQFDIFRPTVFNLLSILIQQMGINKPEFSHFVGYLLEMYMNGSLGKFIGDSNRLKRVNLMLGGIKLACHFLCPRFWNQGMLGDFNFCSERVQKYSRILFGLFMDMEKNIMIHEKYKISRYKGVSKIKVVNTSKSSRNLSKSTQSQSHEQISGSQRGLNDKIKCRKEKGFYTEKILLVSC